MDWTLYRFMFLVAALVATAAIAALCALVGLAMLWIAIN